MDAQHRALAEQLVRVARRIGQTAEVEFSPELWALEWDGEEGFEALELRADILGLSVSIDWLGNGSIRCAARQFGRWEETIGDDVGVTLSALAGGVGRVSRLLDALLCVEKEERGCDFVVSLIEGEGGELFDGKTLADVQRLLEQQP